MEYGRNVSMEWKIFSVEWKKLASMDISAASGKLGGQSPLLKLHSFTKII